jgi:Arc/MetJ-type ribon-helix-helix transcriptional regulator
MAQPKTLEKVTFSLPTELVRELREVVAGGQFPSQNALVRDALRRELKRARDERLQKEMEAAARDPRFIRDVEETMDAFKWADAETARMIPE